MTYDAHKIADVFGRAAATYDTVIPFFAELGARLVDIAALQPGESVLDLGCGRGATLFPAAERVGAGGRVLGVDLAEEMLEHVRDDIAARGLDHVDVRRMDAQDLDVEPGSFDAVIVSFVLHLLPDPDQAAASAARAVRAGGRVAASVPTGGGSEWEFLGRIFGAYAQRSGHPMVVPFRPEFDLPATLAGASLRVAQTVDDQLDFWFPDEQAWWDWAWSHGMRGLLEVLDPADLEGLRRDMFAELAALRTARGIRMEQRAVFVVAEKTAG